MIPALIGLFAITEILNKAKNSQEAAGTLEAYKKVTLKLKTILQYWKILIKSSCIGTFIGAVPERERQLHLLSVITKPKEHQKSRSYLEMDLLKAFVHLNVEIMQLQEQLLFRF